MGKKVIAQEFPIGIDPEEYRTSMASEATKSEMSRLRDNFQDKRIILGVDRLDYTKGIPQKLRAFEVMLIEHPELMGKVVLVQLCVPTRSTVAEYIQLRSEVEELIGRINGAYGTLTWTPIQYLHKSLEKDTLHALYGVSDVCVVSAVRDGLNLVSYEYVASQIDQQGVLMLSQYTGAAEMLKTAVHFNPWDTPRFAEAMSTALSMPPEERGRRIEAALSTVNQWTSTKWGLSFLEALQSCEN
jgi:trehalose 6-phosphate synthase